MLCIIFLTFAFYFVATCLIHVAMVLFSPGYSKLNSSQEWRVTFRLVRCIAGLKGAFGFFYALWYKDSLGILGTTELSKLMFKSYIGYIIFELFLLYITYRSITAFFTDHGLRLLLVHHIVAGVASWSIGSGGDDPRPHFIGLLNFGNEVVVVSYSLIVVFRKFGMNNHWFVEWNVRSLPVQYALRQILFMYTFYYILVHYSVLMTCGTLFYASFMFGTVFFTFGLNPYWLYETIIDSQEYQKAKKA